MQQAIAKRFSGLTLVAALWAAGCNPVTTNMLDDELGGAVSPSSDAPTQEQLSRTDPAAAQRVKTHAKTAINGVMTLVADEAVGDPVDPVAVATMAVGDQAFNHSSDVVDKIDWLIGRVTDMLWQDVEPQACVAYESEVIDAEYQGNTIHAELSGVTICASDDGTVAYWIDAVSITAQNDTGQTCHLEIHDLHVVVGPGGERWVTLSEADIEATHPTEGTLQGTVRGFQHHIKSADGTVAIEAAVEQAELEAASSEGTLHTELEGLHKAVVLTDGVADVAITIQAARSHLESSADGSVATELTGVAAQLHVEGTSVDLLYSIQQVHVVAEGPDGATFEASVTSLLLVTCSSPNCLADDS